MHIRWVLIQTPDSLSCGRLSVDRGLACKRPKDGLVQAQRLPSFVDKKRLLYKEQSMIAMQETLVLIKSLLQFVEDESFHIFF